MQHQKPTKQTFSEWLKWKCSIHNSTHTLHLIPFYCYTKQTIQKASTKITCNSNKLVSFGVDYCLTFLSTRKWIPWKQVGNGIRYPHHKAFHKSWIPANLMSLQEMVFASTSSSTSNKAVFDSDIYPILIDNCCTAWITNCIKDFCNTPQTTKSSIKI